MSLLFYLAEKGGFDFSTLWKRGLSFGNHKYPVFSGANIGIKPICLTLFLMFAHLYFVFFPPVSPVSVPSTGLTGARKSCVSKWTL